MQIVSLGEKLHEMSKPNFCGKKQQQQKKQNKTKNKKKTNKQKKKKNKKKQKKNKQKKTKKKTTTTKNIQSTLFTRPHLSRITAYLEVKIWSLF